MEPAVWLHVDVVLRARDALLAARIQVIEYDLHPNGAGALLIHRDDHERALAALTSRRIRYMAVSPLTVRWPPRAGTSGKERAR